MAPEFQLFKSAILRIYPKLSLEEWDYLLEKIEVTHLLKKSYYIKDGEIQRNIGFVTSGLIRGLYVDAKGEENTVRFIKENGYATHYSSLLQQKPSNYSFQCLENCTIVNLPLKAIQEGYDEFPGLDRYGRLIAESILLSQQERIEDLQFLNAEERYLKFIRQNADLFNRISLAHLSSYLGIQRPSLSRIRKKLASNGNM